MKTLSAEKRDMQIKAKKLRREGFVTGNVFGKNMEGSMPLKIEKKEAERILRTCNKGSQLILTVEGQKMPVLLKEIDYNAMKHEIVEMDFQALVKGEKVHSVAEVVLLNHEKVKSGVVELLLEEISYEALPENLIEKVEIDLWGQRHLRHLKQSHKVLYYNLLTSGKLNSHIAEMINRRTICSFSW